MTLEQLGIETRIVDTFGNQFRKLEWYEIRGLTQKGKSLFNVVNPTFIARLRDRAYNEETRASNFVYQVPSTLENTIARQPMPQWSVAPMHDHSARIDPNLIRPRLMRSMGRVTRSPIDAYVPRLTRRHEDDNPR